MVHHHHNKSRGHNKSPGTSASSTSHSLPLLGISICLIILCTVSYLFWELNCSLCQTILFFSADLSINLFKMFVLNMCYPTQNIHPLYLASSFAALPASLSFISFVSVHTSTLNPAHHFISCVSNLNLSKLHNGDANVLLK